MIAKFICWLFGHQIRDRYFNGSDYTVIWHTNCPRCGARLNRIQK